MNAMMNTLTFENTKAVLPLVKEAEDKYWQDVENVQTDAEFTALTAEFNKVLDKAIAAIYEDTKDRNSFDTLKHVFSARGEHDTHFGIRPTKAIEDFITNASAPDESPDKCSPEPDLSQKTN